MGARGVLTVERPVPGLKRKNLQTPAKRRMKAFNESTEKRFSDLVSSFSLTEKRELQNCNAHDEHS